MNTRSVAINYCRRIIYFMGSVSLTTSSNPRALFLAIPQVFTSLKTPRVFLENPVFKFSYGTLYQLPAGENLYQFPSVTSFTACWAQEGNPSTPAGKPQNIPQCFLHAPALHGYGIASGAPRFGTLQLLTTSLNLTQKMTPAPLVIPRRQQAILASLRVQRTALSFKAHRSFQS